MTGASVSSLAHLSVSSSPSRPCLPDFPSALVACMDNTYYEREGVNKPRSASMDHKSGENETTTNTEILWAGEQSSLLLLVSDDTVSITGG